MARAQAKSKTKQATTRVTRHYNRGLVPGITLIVLGALFFLQSYSSFQLNNWWALIFLVPTVGAWNGAYTTYKRAGVVNHQVWASFVAGLVPATLAIIFLNDLDWGKVWPIFIILFGLAAINPMPHTAKK